MSLSCSCSDDYEWFFEEPSDYSTLQTSKRKRCWSCKELIDIGSVCMQFETYRPPRDDIEERINGDEVYMADKYYCESCSDIFYSLKELGFCMVLGDMNEALLEYKEYYNHTQGDER